MGEFKRGQIFKAILPQAEFTNRILPPTPLVSGEHFVVVLHDSDNQNYDSRQVLVVPIVTEEEIIRSGQAILITHIPICSSDYDFIEENSFICTHKVMTINRNWLLEEIIEDISGTEFIYKIDLGIINAAGLINLIESFIEEKAHQLKLKYDKRNYSNITLVSQKRSFKRGDVFYSRMPKQIFDENVQPPAYTLFGEHMVVVLYDSDDKNFDLSQVLIVPITSATATVRSGNLLPTHIELLPVEFSFIKKQSYVSTHQIMPINREWLDLSSKGDISAKMLEIDLAIALATDLTNSMDDIINLRINEFTEEALRKLQEQLKEKDA